MKASIKLPYYARVALVFVSVFALIFTLRMGQDIIVPLVYAIILAILLNPLVNYLVRKRVPGVIAIGLAVMLITLTVLGSLYIIITQLISFSETIPQLKEKFYSAILDLVGWISATFSVNQTTIQLWIRETLQQAVDNFTSGKSLDTIRQVIVTLTLLPVYLAMILYHKPLLLEFVHKLFRARHQVALVEVLANTKQIIQTYIVGLCFELIIMAVLQSVGLLVLGIEYAIILGIIGALLNIIPYIGGIVGTALAMIIAFVTKDSIAWSFYVLVFYILIQFIDNNFIVPRIVASRVQLNALVSIIVVLIGSAVWGISGMFLSIPLTAIVKVIFDHIEPLKPWGFLLGKMVPAKTKYSLLVITKGERKKGG
jgi:predicted PurR-regulated permease PerM